MEKSMAHIVDDEPAIREALRSLLGSVGLGCTCYSSPREFLLGTPPEIPGCIVSDVRMPEMSGLDFQRECRKRGLEMPMILMTGHGDLTMAVSAMKAGAVDFLAKPFRDQDMIDAVFAAIELDAAKREDTAQTLALSERLASLTPREREVLELVSKGKLNKQMAYDLSLSEVTIKVHRGTMMRKMGARNLAELIRMADRLDVGARQIS